VALRALPFLAAFFAETFLILRFSIAPLAAAFLFASLFDATLTAAFFFATFLAAFFTAFLARLMAALFKFPFVAFIRCPLFLLLLSRTSTALRIAAIQARLATIQQDERLGIALAAHRGAGWEGAGGFGG